MKESQKIRIDGMKEYLEEFKKRNDHDLATYTDAWLTGFAEGANIVCEYVLKEIDYLQKAEK